jgi:poly(3-hydroxybutyrate) depolymerase
MRFSFVFRCGVGFLCAMPTSRIRTSKLLAGFAVAMAGAALLAAEPLPVGMGRTECPTGGEPLTLFTYKPPNYKSGPLLVVFHGVVRNAEDYRRFAQPMADRFGMLLAAPLLDARTFPEEWYQRGGITGPDGQALPADRWIFSIVPKIIAHLRAQEQAPALHCYLIGHSAGAQFLVRLAAYLPVDAVRIVAGNPGAQLFPNRDHEYGYGFGGLPESLSDDAVLRRYLAAPLTLYLGTGDTTPRRRFDASPPAMRQGPHRLARNRACFELAQKLAKERGWAFNWRKVETPGIEHDAAAMFAAAEAEDALFGAK